MANRFVDITKSTGTLTGTVTFTNGSTTVTGSGTLFTTELAVGNYIRVSDGVEWYKVTAIASDTSLTISPAFQQATITDAANSTKKNAENGQSATTAFCHINQATTDEVRAAGDVIYCRRGQTHLYKGIDIVFDEDGAFNSFVTLEGDDGTGWPGEAGLSKPVIGFGDSSFQALLSGDAFWAIKDFEYVESLDSGALAFMSSSDGGLIEKCDFHDNELAGGYKRGFMVSASSVTLKDCTFYNNGNQSCYTDRSILTIFNCTLNGGPLGTSDGLWAGFSFVKILDTTFGVTTAHTNDIDIAYPSVVIGRNVKLASPTEVGGITASTGLESSVKIEDDEQTKLANRAWFNNGMNIRDTTVVRSGGASSSARMEPNSNCGLQQPLKLCKFTEELSRWLAAGSHTCTIYLRGSGWTTFPTADELYIEVLYYDGVTAKRASIKSTEVLNANDTWTAFDVSFTLNSDSPCYANVVLKKYISGAKIYVDILPVWS